MICTIITSNLEVSTILAQAESKHLSFNKPLLMHDIKNRLLMQHVRVLCQAKDSVSGLSVEQMGL